MKLTEQQIVSNYEKIISIIEDNFEGERKTNLLKLYSDFDEKIMLAPASGKDYYHSAYPGGYVVHVLNVIECVKRIEELWISNGMIKTYSDESILFVALNHDLGKIGDHDGEYYMTHNEKWRKERGEIYIINDKIRFMTVPDRGMWLLQNYGIKISQSEMIAIKLHDGMYDESNKAYLVSYSEGKQLKDEMPIIIHHADMMACTIEKNNWSHLKNSNNIEKTDKKPDKKIKNKQMADLTKDFFKNIGEK